MNTTISGRDLARRRAKRKMYKRYSAAKVKEQQLQNIYEVVLDEINSVMLDKEYVA